MKRKRLTYKLPAKICAFFLLAVSLCSAVLSVVGIAVMWDQQVYTSSYNEVLDNYCSSIAYGEARSVCFDVLNGDSSYAQRVADHSNADFQVVDKDNAALWSSREDFDSYSSEDHFGTYTYMYVKLPDGDLYLYQTGAFKHYEFGENADYEYYAVNVCVNPDMPIQDSYRLALNVAKLMYSLRYGVYAICSVSVILLIVCFVFLMCSAGHREGHEEIVSSWITKIPFDLLTAAVAFLICLAVMLGEEASYHGMIAGVIAVSLLILACASIFTGWCVSFATRVKLGGWWRNTVIYRILRLIKRIWLALWRGVKELAGNLPLIWKAILGLLAISLLEFCAIIACWWESDVLLFMWLLEKLIVIPAVLFLSLTLRRLQRGGAALAEGDLSYQVDTSHMLWDFKRHGENLNNIALGMNRAVEERLKSERLKTELITNVSHDIKTPLTSIINYSDLICKESCDNEKIREYSAVLLRQSERLKKLINDLVEASKASTGNVEVLLSPFEVGVLLTQTAGEYEQRLHECGLELITRQPEGPVRIMADGRHMWRIFDNLMNNICKYALSGTRVYLTVEEKFGQAVISFKNTSKYALDVSSEELMERFVRGDSSRNTEGSGLGLSIARSLTELQNGKLEITVDGDLFKAVLRFDEIK